MDDITKFKNKIKKLETDLAIRQSEKEKIVDSLKAEFGANNEESALKIAKSMDAKIDGFQKKRDELLKKANAIIGEINGN